MNSEIKTTNFREMKVNNFLDKNLWSKYPRMFTKIKSNIVRVNGDNPQEIKVKSATDWANKDLRTFASVLYSGNSQESLFDDNNTYYLLNSITVDNLNQYNVQELHSIFVKRQDLLEFVNNQFKFLLYNRPISGILINDVVNHRKINMINDIKIYRYDQALLMLIPKIYYLNFHSSKSLVIKNYN